MKGQNQKEGQRSLQNAANEQAKQKLLRISEVSLWLDTYDDIFSDFDPRPYSERALSDDFLLEAKRAVRDKPSGGIELKFLIPAVRRNMHEEELIKRRLHDHFKKHSALLQKERKGLIDLGLAFTAAGIALMAIASFILLEFPQKNFLVTFLVVLFEPAGWFLFWEGLHQIVFEQKTKSPDLEFYKKMLNCKVQFLSY